MHTTVFITASTSQVRRPLCTAQTPDWHLVVKLSPVAWWSLVSLWPHPRFAYSVHLGISYKTVPLVFSCDLTSSQSSAWWGTWLIDLNSDHLSPPDTYMRVCSHSHSMGHYTISVLSVTVDTAEGGHVSYCAWKPKTPVTYLTTKRLNYWLNHWKPTEYLSLVGRSTKCRCVTKVPECIISKNSKS